VSTWRMERLVDALGIARMSKSQVSVIAAELDAQVAEFRGRPLEQCPTRSWRRTPWCSRSVRADGS
jgi:putative transposase